ncbi:hypothetical protein DL93DRAFT_2061690 [Clavulina sp. PMI_390]|nr:hypothetical protein DL93DRAFT_2061690 [Clavulina sp. PMI_390]
MNESIPTRSVAESLGFPPGYFSIRSMSTGKYWDIHGNFDADGTLVYLWREKEKSLVEDLRDPRADNQVFFVDYTGALCSKASGHAIDVEGTILPSRSRRSHIRDHANGNHLMVPQDGHVVLRRHRPMTFPFPNAYSHPLPRFAYDSSSGNLHVRFNYDPAYPLPSSSPSMVWQEKQYLVSSIPKRKPPTVFDNAAQFFSDAVSVIAAPVSGVPATPHPDDNGEFDLRENEIMEEERGVENDADDSPDIARDICVLSLPFGTDSRGSPAARERRRWEILPITKGKATFRAPART